MTSQLDFDAFYEFAFPRVYRFALKRQGNARSAEVLCRLILERALEHGKCGASADSVEPGFWLFAIAKRVADEVECSPELLAEMGGSTKLH
jgi:DNA-directed RNA polymerase specialized sigma24 family protein